MRRRRERKTEEGDVGSRGERRRKTEGGGLGSWDREKEE